MKHFCFRTIFLKYALNSSPGASLCWVCNAVMTKLQMMVNNIIMVQIMVMTFSMKEKQSPCSTYSNKTPNILLYGRILWLNFRFKMATAVVYRFLLYRQNSWSYQTFNPSWRKNKNGLFFPNDALLTWRVKITLRVRFTELLAYKFAKFMHVQLYICQSIK